MGSYIFFWGQKQEYTPTWFSLFLANGAKTPIVDLMSRLWGGVGQANLAPFLDSIIIKGEDLGRYGELKPSRVFTASVECWDPENDTLRHEWKILPDGPFFTYIADRGKVEILPDQLHGLIRQQEGNQITFQAPATIGSYRLFVYVYDNQGNGAYANRPLFVVNNELEE